MQPLGLAALLLCLTCHAGTPGTCPGSAHSSPPGVDDPRADHLGLAIAADERGDYDTSLAYFQAAVKFNRTPFNMVVNL